jgi:hypothetical protein
LWWCFVSQYRSPARSAKKKILALEITCLFCKRAL